MQVTVSSFITSSRNETISMMAPTCSLKHSWGLLSTSTRRSQR
jgi:hypothetical protein